MNSLKATSIGLWSDLIVKVIRPIVRFFLVWLYRIEFHGLENIPMNGPFIITPNHVSYMDPVLIGLAIRRRIFFMTWDKIFQVPIVGSMASLFGAFPVRLEGHDRVAVKRTQRHLREGMGVMIFPEGGRTTTGKLDPFKIGAFRLAVKERVPVVPVTINGAYQVWPPEQKLPSLNGRITIYYHQPIFPSTLQEQEVKARTQEMAYEARKKIISTLQADMVPNDYQEGIVSE